MRLVRLTWKGARSPNGKTVHKNAFQWDAYCPLVDRIPACTVPGGVPAGGCTCPGDVPAQGWCTCQGVYLPRGEYLSGGCTCRGGVTCPGTAPPVDRHV